MGYTMRNGKYADTLEINLAPIEGVLTQDGNSAVVEVGSKRVLNLHLLIDSVSTDDTLDVTIQTSFDGVTWYSAGTFTQATDAGGDPLDQRKDFVVNRFVRADFNVGGSSVSIPCTLRGEAA